MTHQSPKTDLFEAAVRHVIGVEGGYVWDPADRGGETKFGISKRKYPHLNIPELTLDQAVEIYRQDYWHKHGCDRLPPAFGILLFDAVVNHRTRTAVRLLQMALGVVVDGYLGPRTIAAAESACRFSSYPEILATAFAHRADFYHDLITADSSQARFALGWFKRLFLLQQFINEHVQVRAKKDVA